MKYLLALSTVATLVAAQNLNGEPGCASSCLSSAISAAGCAPSDEACQCGTGQAAIGSYAAPCLIAACTNPGDLLAAASVGGALCSMYSASLTSSSISGSSTAVASPSLTSVSSTTTESQRSTGSSVLTTASQESTTNQERSTGSSAITSATNEASTNQERSTGSSAAPSAASTSSKSVGNINKAFSVDFGMTLAVGAVIGGFMMVGAVLL